MLISGSLLFSLHFFGVGSAVHLWGGLPWFEQRQRRNRPLMATCGSFLFMSQALAAGNPRNRLMRAMRWGAAGTALLALAFALDLFDTRVLAAIVSVLGLVPALMGIPVPWRACARAIDGRHAAAGLAGCTSWPRPR